MDLLSTSEDVNQPLNKNLSAIDANTMAVTQNILASLNMQDNS